MSNKTFSIGVLLPRSNLYPALGANFLAGLRLALAGDDRPAGRAIDLVVEDYGFGQIMAEEQCKKLLHWHGVALITGLISVNLAAILQPILEPQQKLFLAANIGENIPRGDEYHQLFFHHTLGLWQANWAFGRWAAANLGQAAIVSQSHYDGGYDLPYAFRQGFEQAGGSFQRIFISHIPPDRGNFAPLLAEIAERRPAFVFGSYCGPTAVQFVRAYHAAGLAAHTPLLGSAMLADASLLDELGEAAVGIRTARAWPDQLSGPFAAAYAAQQQGPPDGFALLGYESGLILAQAIRAAGDAADRPAALHAAMSAAAVEGPRGRLSFDPQSQSTQPAAIFLREVRRLGDALTHQPIAELAPPELDHPDFAAIRSGLRSGWLNTYLAI